jgi:signal transduction histidine kinase
MSACATGTRNSYSNKVLFSSIREFLLPAAAERDEPFRHQVLRSIRHALLTLGMVEVALPVILYLVRLAVAPANALRMVRVGQTVALVAVGIATAAVARARWSSRLGRPLVIASAACATTALILVTRLLASEYLVLDDFIPTVITFLLLTVTVAPLYPLHVLALGAGIELLCRIAAPGHDLFLFMLTLVSTAMTAELYRRRRSDYVAHQQALKIAEALSGAQLRAQLAENAAAIGKLAAAVTHEINTPLGALASGVDTLLVVAAKQATVSPEQQQRMVTMQADLRRSVQSSIDRIRAVITRLQRFINLEEAELQSANINELISDVSILFQGELKDKVKVEFDFRPVPTVMCRPQLLSAVISSLVSNAIKACNGEGRVVVSTRRSVALIEITIRDTGCGMSPEEIESIFDPGFKVYGTRVSSGNWSLFNSRQIIFEHGGDISIDSAVGKGTTVCVTLPCQ